MKYGSKLRERVNNTKNPENCVVCGRNDVREMAPEDVESQRASEAEAAKNIDAFFERNHDKLKALVQTYGDGRAESLLQELRELFWAANPTGSQ